jgi:non-homologous end joining protein Ku
MPKAKPSTRPTENVQLQFGPIVIPISAYSGIVSNHGINRSMFIPTDDGDDHPVGFTYYDKETDERVDGSAIVKKINTDYGYVYVSEEEIEQLLNLQHHTLIVKHIQPLSVFLQGHYVPKTLYFLEASKRTQGRKKVRNVAAEQAFTVLLTALRKSGAVAVCELTTRGVPKPCVLMPTGQLWICYYTDELREQRPVSTTGVDTNLVALTQQLCEKYWEVDPVEMDDRRTALVQLYADEKGERGDFDVPKPSDDSLIVEESVNENLLMALNNALKTA